MTQVLRQSTQVLVRIGPFVDATDGLTPETGITLGSADEAELMKSAGTATVDISGNTWAAVSSVDGWYNLTLSTSNTGQTGTLDVVVQDDSVCLPVFARFQVVTAAVFDAMYGSSAAGPLQSTTSGRTLDVTAGGTAGIDWGNVENASTAVDLSATDIQLCDTVTTNTDMRGTDSAALASVCTETRLSELDAATAGKMANQVDEIRTDTGEIGTAGAGLTNINLPDQTMNITGNITGNLSGSVGSVTGNVGGSVASVTGAINTAAGTITTLDALDTAQDSQHSTTQGKVDTAQADLDTITGADGVTLATTQSNYAPATSTALATAQSDLDTLTGSDGATLATSQPNVGNIPGTAQTGTLSTTVMTTDLTGYADDELIGRVVIWTGGTASGQASDITDYASASGTVTYTAITTAPANGDTFVIV